MKTINLVIPAAGAATRLRPLSTNTSKVMVRVNGKPCLDYIIEYAKKNAIINEIVVVDGKFDDIRTYCATKHPSIKFANQPQLDGPRDAIKLGIEALTFSEYPVVVWLGDAIILEEDMPLGTDFLLTKKVNNQSSWCMWDGHNYFNKPTTHVEDAEALVGLYSFKNGQRALSAFRSTNEYDISYALELYGKFNKVTTNKWYDIGDLSSYYKTSAELLKLKSRAFNNITSKSPNYHMPDSITILETEKKWYTGLTLEQSMFVPRVYNTENTLTMSYESGTLLSDMMLYDNIAPSAWEYIIDKVIKIKLKYFNNTCRDSSFISSFDKLSKEMWIEKSIARLNKTNFSKEIFDKLVDIANKVYYNTIPIDGMHGDLHFGNILYNAHTDQIRFIDPRGQYGNYIGTSGDNIYDFAKLSHDLFHGYNSMVSNVPHNDDVRRIFIEKLDELNLDHKLINDAGILLLATCIPLHYDDENRMKRFEQKVIDYVSQR
jgi:glucose-1-phosphate thymidylyltransferase